MRGRLGGRGEGAGRWLARAKRAAQRRGQRPTTAHLLLALFEGDGEAQSALAALGLVEGDLLAALRAAPEEPSAALDVTLERADQLAERRGGGAPAGPRDLLEAVARDPRSAGGRVLAVLGLSPGAFGERGEPAPKQAPRGKSKARARRPPSPAAGLGGRRCGTTGARPVPPPKAKGSRSPAEARRASGDDAAAASSGPVGLEAVAAPVLSQLGRDLTAAAARGELDPVLGRDREIERILDVLGRRRSNNPVLVGPPGVGKTAVVEGLAQRLLESTDDRLRQRILVELAPAAFLAGTGVRGALGERLGAIRKEVAQSGGRILLFIDEIHALVGAEGQGGGPDDLATALKPALARGELPCIGATTDDEHARVFERDPALARRFAPVPVDEPDPATAKGIVRGVLPVYARHHELRFDPATVDAAVEWTARYLPERRLPDKALSALDVAGARARRRGLETVDRGVLAEVVGEMASVPADRLLSEDRRKLLDLEAGLGERIVGQSDALGRIAAVLRKAAAGLRREDRPLGTFLLLGPTGVGKTETAKALAETVFGSPEHLARFDLAEHAEAHSVARLLGAPPGYVGHGDGGQLTEAIRRRAHQVLLFDEVEKAHPDVLLALLPLLDEGRLTDGRGRVVDARESVIVLTSNLGAEAVAAAGSPSPRIGFGASSPPDPGAARARALDAARGALPPELWNRIDEPLVYRALDEDDALAVARRLVAGVGARLTERRAIRLSVSDDALDILVAAGFDPSLGARPLARAVGRLLEAPLAERLLAGRLEGATTIRVSADARGGLAFVPVALADDEASPPRHTAAYRRGLGDPGWNDPRQLTIEGA